MKNIIEYLSRNTGRVLDIAEAVVKVSEKIVAAAVEIVPITPTVKDDVIVGRVRAFIVPIRKGLDKVRNFFLKRTAS